VNKLILTDQKLVSLRHLMSLVQSENLFQIEKWGVQSRSPFEWNAYLNEEVGELARSICEHYYRGGDKKHVIREAIQVVTLALKIAEMYEGLIDEQHPTV